MSDLSAFSQKGATVSISASTTTANAAISDHSGSIVAHNTTSVWAYLTTGIGNALAATTAGYWLAPNSSQALSIPTNHNYAAALLASGTGTIGITPGEGQ